MSDIFRPIEPFYVTQGFGENPDLYKRFGLIGHNGWDLRTKYDDSPNGKRDILASWFSKFYDSFDQGNDGYGKGFNVIVQLYNTYKLLYAHCDQEPSFDDRDEGETMGISDNTGNSTAPHLHLTVKEGRLVGDKFETNNADNGYFGAIDPQIFFDELRAFKKAGNQPTPPISENWIKENSDKWRGLVWHLELEKDPEHTLLEDVKRVIAGYKSRETDLKNQLHDKNIQLEKSNTEIDNRKEQIGRLNNQLTNLTQTHKAEVRAIMESIPNVDKIHGEYRGKIKDLHTEVDQWAKRCGKLKIELAVCRAGKCPTFWELFFSWFK